jgi:NADPH-dependent ferric siderophore reductase
LAGAGLADFEHLPGQDLMVSVPLDGGRVIRRRYTIRRLDRAAGRLDLQIMTLASGPGVAWVRGLRVGDEVEAVGPRGKISLVAEVPWHLFVGDEVAVPGFAAMIERLPAGSRATVRVESGVELGALRPTPGAGVELDWVWLPRIGAPGQAETLLRAVTALPPAPLPGSLSARVYLAGEAGVVAGLRTRLCELGWSDDTISAKAYWGLGRANVSHGEPARLPS